MTERISELDDWAADWDGHHRWQLTAALDTSPTRRLAWLEEAIAFAYRAGALPRRPVPDGAPSPIQEGGKTIA